MSFFKIIFPSSEGFVSLLFMETDSTRDEKRILSSHGGVTAAGKASLHANHNLSLSFAASSSKQGGKHQPHPYIVILLAGNDSWLSVQGKSRRLCRIKHRACFKLLHLPANSPLHPLPNLCKDGWLEAHRGCPSHELIASCSDVRGDEASINR